MISLCFFSFPPLSTLSTRLELRNNLWKLISQEDKGRKGASATTTTTTTTTAAATAIAAATTILQSRPRQ